MDNVAVEQPQLMTRKILRRHIVRIINARLPLPYRLFYKPSAIVKQAMVFDEFFYKTAHCMEEYVDVATLERRTVQIARKMRERRYPKLFVFFYMGD
ncbi:hypothetical protein ACHAXN_003877 [Cyclotella atomus]